MKAKHIFIGSALIASAFIVSCSGNNESDQTVPETATTEIAEPEQTTPTVPAWMPDSAQITPSGLGIVIENPGDSTRATNTTPVTLHYRGRLTNGTVFDSSYDRGEPATFSAVQVIPGFGEGIMMVGNGGKATLYIPSNLGYGPHGAGAMIGPNENLIFDIEVLQIGQ